MRTQFVLMQAPRQAATLLQAEIDNHRLQVSDPLAYRLAAILAVTAPGDRLTEQEFALRKMHASRMLDDWRRHPDAVVITPYDEATEYRLLSLVQYCACDDRSELHRIGESVDQ